MTPDPSFPDAGTYRGEELRRWLREWSATWEGNRLEVLEMEDQGEAVTMLMSLASRTCRTGQDEIPVDDFTLVWWFQEGDASRPIRWAAFFDRERALEAARSGPG